MPAAGAWVLAGGVWQRKGRTSRFPGGVLPPGRRTVILAPQAGGTTRSATTASELTTALAASQPGDSIACTGSFGNFTTSKNLASGLVRIFASTPNAATFGRVDLSSAVGLDWLGMKTTDEVYYASTARCLWRGGWSAFTNHVPTGHNIRQSCTDLTIEDSLVENADCSFFLFADRDSTASTDVKIRHNRSDNVGQDHVFGGRGTFVYVDGNEFYGHTEDPEHQDHFQVVGLKDFFLRRNHFWNSRAFRDAAVDRNDHGVMINYDPAEVGAGSTAGRKPERGLLENNLIHDTTSTAIAIAGGLNMKLRYNTCYDVGAAGSATAVVFAPDSGNTVTVDELIGNVLKSLSVTSTTITTNTHNFVADGSGPAGTSRLTGAPGFVDAANADYRLTTGSQNRASGTATGGTVIDLYSRARPGTPSRGALEYAA